MKKLLLSLCFIPFLVFAQNSHIINTAGNTFSPSSLAINVGDTVTWNNTAGYHNVNGTQAAYPNNPDGFGNGVVAAPWSFQWIFTLAGTYDYQCDPHVGIGMVGQIVVNSPPPPALTYVPDNNFEQRLIQLGYDNILDDSVLTSNINTVVSLDVSSYSISNLTGIEDFSNLHNLFCNDNYILTLDVSNLSSLNRLDCQYNDLTVLDVSNNSALTILDCGANYLTNLDVSQNTSLTNLACYGNDLTSLDVNNNLDLIGLWCPYNNITNLDVSIHTNLTNLWCFDNNLSSLDVRNGNNTNLAQF